MVAPGSPLLWWDGFVVAFVLTCVVELPAYLLTFVTLGGCRVGPYPQQPMTVPSALAVTLITHPC